MVRSKKKGGSNNKKNVRTNQQQLPPKEVGSSSRDKDDEPNTHASSSRAPNSFIIPQKNTIIVGNLPDCCNEPELYNFFCEVGEPTVRMDAFENGECKGSAQIEFATAEAVCEACKLNGTEFMGKVITINFGHERSTICSDTSLKKPDDFSDYTVLITGFDAAYSLETIDMMLRTHFAGCRPFQTDQPIDKETGASKGSMFMEFRDEPSVEKALLLNESELGGFSLHVEKAAT